MLIYLALGSNLGDRKANLEHAIHLLSPEVQCEEESSVYQTTPWGFSNQPDFLNQVIQGSTQLSPEDLLKYVKSIEKEMGRETKFRFGPRVIDIDILFYGEKIIDQKGLQIPHSRLHQRAFVLIPLCDLTREFVHPVNGRTIQEMLDLVDTEGVEHYQPDNDNSSRI